MSVLNKIYFRYDITPVVVNERLYPPHCITYMKGVNLLLDFWPVFCLKSNTRLLRNLEKDTGNGTRHLAG